MRYAEALASHRRTCRNRLVWGWILLFVAPLVGLYMLVSQSRFERRGYEALQTQRYRGRMLREARRARSAPTPAAPAPRYFG